MKRMIIITLSGMGLIMLLSLYSCYTQKNITHSSQPLSADALRQLEPQKVYKIHYANGLEYKVRVDSTGDSTFYATTLSIIARDAKGQKLSKAKDAKQRPYVHEYTEILKNADRVTTWKFKPLLSSLLILSLAILSVYIYIFFAWLFLP